MPILDGWDFLLSGSLIAARRGAGGRHVSSEGNRWQGEGSGAAVVMRKPIMPEALLQVIERYAATA